MATNTSAPFVWNCPHNSCLVFYTCDVVKCQSSWVPLCSVLICSASSWDQILKQKTLGEDQYLMERIYDVNDNVRTASDFISCWLRSCMNSALLPVCRCSFCFPPPTIINFLWTLWTSSWRLDPSDKAWSACWDNNLGEWSWAIKLLKILQGVNI